MNAVQLIESLNLLEEHERIEAKKSSEIGKSLLETICAYANEPGLGGGWILAGVARDENALFSAYVAEGVPDPEELSADIASKCSSVFNMPLRVDITTELVNNRPVLAIFVPESAPQDKPIFFKSQGLPRGAFRRIGSTDQHCTEDDLIALYTGRQVESFDSGILTDASEEDFLAETIDEYRKTRAEANPDAEELQWTDEELLQALGCIRRNEHGQWYPTVAGMILFGKPTALRRCFPMIRVDYIRIAGREWVPDPDHRFETIELRDPLFRLIRRTLATILDDLPKAFGLKENTLQREEISIIPRRVLREALVNALMHRSYRNQSPVQIIRYSNRLEIRNPGFSLKSMEHLGEPGSTPRNPKIAAVLHETRFAETKGSGIRVMRQMMETSGLTPPLFESDRGQDLFVARFFFHHFLSPEDLDWLSRFKDMHLSEEQARVLIFVREAGAIDNSTYRDLNKVDVLTASQSLRHLRDSGLLTQKGRGPATWYQPTELLLGANNIESSFPAATSMAPQSNSSNPQALDSNPQALEEVLVQERRKAMLSELPQEVIAKIQTLGQRNKPEEIQALILSLCNLHPWKAEEIAILLNRNIETVRQKYLRPLKRKGLIVMTRPEVPNDPEQAYTVRKVDN